MILLKTAWNDFKKNIAMNIFIIFQVAVSLIITAVMISTISIRAQYYTPFKDILSSNGLFLKVGYNSWNYEPSKQMIYDYLDNEDILQECPSANGVYSCYRIHGIIEADSYVFQSYDDEWIERYQPELVEGRWLTTSTDSNQIEIVVSENDYNIGIGDTISFSGDNFNSSDLPEPTNFTGKVVGIFKDNSNVIGLHQYDYGNADMNFRNLYYPFNHKIDEQIAILASHTAIQNISNNAELLFDVDYVVQPINSNVIITYPDDVSYEQIEADRDKLLKYGFASVATLDEMHDNSIKYLMEKAEILLPIIVIVFILASVSTISSSALLARKNLKNYAIYYTTGLQWKHCSIVNLLHSVISFTISVIIVFAVLLAIPHTVFAESVKIIWSWYIIAAFGILILLQLIISMIMPIIIIGKNTPKQILTK